MAERGVRISDESVKKATGKTWSEWKTFLDQKGARTMAHKDIAAMLYQSKWVKSPWWAQMVTVGYEFSHGKRVAGQNAKEDFDVSVQKSFSVPSEKLWSFLVSENGTAIWLGSGVRLGLRKGAAFATADDTTGQVRTMVLGRTLRLHLTLPGFKTHSVVQISLTPTASGQSTALRFDQEKLASAAVREKMRTRWQKALHQLYAVFS